MAFTQVTVTHTFENADGTTPTGSVTFRLTERMTNGTTTIEPIEITATLTSGVLSQVLFANDDTATVPGPNNTGGDLAPAQYMCTIRLGTYQAVETYYFTLPHADSPTVDLFTLFPTGEQVL
jgi:hypothetical protein